MRAMGVPGAARRCLCGDLRRDDGFSQRAGGDAATRQADEIPAIHQLLYLPRGVEFHRSARLGASMRA